MGRLSNIQVLRALAALLVILSHAMHETVEMAGKMGQPPLDLGFRPWTAAVDVFFTMSGFILLSISYDDFGTPESSRKFFLRRLVRAIPLYWLLTSLVLLTAALMPVMLNVPIGDAKQIVASYLFWPYPRGEGELRPVLALGWTMNLEFFFYVLLALSLAFSRRVGIALLGTALVGTVLVQQEYRFRADAMAFYGSAMTLDFVLGMAIAVAYRDGLRLGSWTTGLAGVLAGLILLQADTADSAAMLRFWTISVPSGVVVAAAVFGPQLPNSRLWQRWLILVGDACYSIYLLQPFLLRPAAKIWTVIVGASLSLWIYVCFGSLLAIAGGVACYLILEQPLTRFLNRNLRAMEQRRQPHRPLVAPAE